MESSLEGTKLPQRLAADRERRPLAADGLKPLSLDINKPTIGIEPSASASWKKTTSTTNGVILPQRLTHTSQSAPWMAKDAYPNGPVCVWGDNLYLYSEPTVDQLTGFDVVINVACELPDLSDKAPTSCEYIKVNWTHTSPLLEELPKLTKLIQQRLLEGRRVLVHCQCGVSRSASLVMAVMMVDRHWSYGEAYEFLKRRVGGISPNLNLIYELMEWEKAIGVV